MSEKKITTVEVSALFWKDLADWRKHPEYAKIRRSIGSLVAKVSRGEPGGDVPFRGNDAWEDVRHIHVGAKLVLFTQYPDESTIRICALKKHDFYGFKRERKSMATNAANVILRAAVSVPKPFPDWNRNSWKDPAEILEDPELSEMSRDALDALYQEIAEEGDTFTKLRRATEGMSEKNASRVADAWLEDLLKAENAVQSVILKRARHRHLSTPQETFTSWASPDFV